MGARGSCQRLRTYPAALMETSLVLAKSRSRHLLLLHSYRTNAEASRPSGIEEDLVQVAGLVREVQVQQFGAGVQGHGGVLFQAAHGGHQAALAL